MHYPPISSTIGSVLTIHYPPFTPLDDTPLEEIEHEGTCPIISPSISEYIAWLRHDLEIRDLDVNEFASLELEINLTLAEPPDPPAEAVEPPKPLPHQQESPRSSNPPRSSPNTIRSSSSICTFHSCPYPEYPHNPWVHDRNVPSFHQLLHPSYSAPSLKPRPLPLDPSTYSATAVRSDGPGSQVTPRTLSLTLNKPLTDIPDLIEICRMVTYELRGEAELFMTVDVFGKGEEEHVRYMPTFCDEGMYCLQCDSCKTELLHLMQVINKWSQTGEQITEEKEEVKWQRGLKRRIDEVEGIADERV